MEILEYGNLEFPEKLKIIEDSPKKIYVMGNKELLKEKTIAVVGSRDCTEYGKQNAYEFGKQIARHGIIVVSGMAKGIDSAAHLGCIENGGKTIAVLGAGFNHIFPKQNIGLFHKIIETGGAVITEYAPNINIKSEQFRQRNRIVSALSMGVLVIEAEHRSGTTITAGFARKQGKPIFCIPNSLDNPKGIGTNELLKKDAILVTNIEDILYTLNLENMKQISIEEFQESKLENKKEIKEEYKKIYNILSDTPMHINDICKKLKINIQDASSTLLMMEMEGLIKNVTGNQYIIV